MGALTRMQRNQDVENKTAFLRFSLNVDSPEEKNSARKHVDRNIKESAGSAGSGSCRTLNKN